MEKIVKYVAGRVYYDRAAGHLDNPASAPDVTVYALTQAQIDAYFGCIKQKAKTVKRTYERINLCLSEVKPDYSTRTEEDGRFSFYPTVLPDGVSLVFVSATGRYIAGSFDLNQEMTVHLEYYEP